jgi:hypothetical protein
MSGSLSKFLSHQDAWKLVVSKIIKIIDSSMDNPTILMMSLACKDLKEALAPVLKKRIFTYRHNDTEYYPFFCSEMGEYRKELFSVMVNTVKWSYTKTVRLDNKEFDYRYMLKKDEKVIGLVIITLANYWRETEIYAVSGSKFVKNKTVKLFATFDTQGWYVAVDNGVDRVVRMKRPLVEELLERDIRSICLA